VCAAPTQTRRSDELPAPTFLLLQPSLATITTSPSLTATLSATVSRTAVFDSEVSDSACLNQSIADCHNERVTGW
jgi:hypothetical protein